MDGVGLHLTANNHEAPIGQGSIKHLLEFFIKWCVNWPISSKASRKCMKLYRSLLVVEPTPLKNMLVKMGSSSPKFRGENKKIFETTT